MSEIGELLESQFSDFNLTPKNHSKNRVHLHADYVELLALVRMPDLVSKADVVNRYRAEGIAVKSLDEELGDVSSAEEDDDYDRWAQQIFRILKDRSKLYGDSYPFRIKLDSIVLNCSASITTMHRVYLTLLMCANLNYFRKLLPTLTTEFETLSYHALKGKLTEKAFVKQFGKNSEYSGSAQSKLRALAKDMMNVEINEKEFNKIDGNQERGLDLVGWFSFNDNYSNFISVLCQCACGKDWYKKLSETKRFHNYFRYEKLRPIHALFIPGAMYSRALDAEGDIFQSDELDDCLLFERLRILEYIDDSDFIRVLDSNTIVSYIIEYEEPLV